MRVHHGTRISAASDSLAIRAWPARNEKRPATPGVGCRPLGLRRSIRGDQKILRMSMASMNFSQPLFSFGGWAFS
jgi:hypothetical protein